MKTKLGDYIAKNQRRIMLSVVAALVVNWTVTAVWAGLPLPHHVVRKLGDTVLQDYWTTNRYEVTYEFQHGVGTNAWNGYVRVPVTNQLW